MNIQDHRQNILSIEAYLANEKKMFEQALVENKKTFVEFAFHMLESAHIKLSYKEKNKLSREYAEISITRVS